jgi:hypothetical protein
MTTFSITGRGNFFVKNTCRGVVWVEKRCSKEVDKVTNELFFAFLKSEFNSFERKSFT